ncbi:hypothetical protein PoB_003509500 [Plakobranchus ocellatus]|uniref:Uncharacterized protein n=1 Tax=Plakobranchus ocellatus TaxID=259542 RepID=A0AAV4AK84_9GAST|nr:hypothetical protein PoB_003509500 [Plakobranchus ocellatus]
MAPPFPLSNRATDVRPGCKTQRIAPTLRQEAGLVCALIKERKYFKTFIVGHVICCLQCGPTLSHDKSRRLQCGPTLRLTRVASWFAAIFSRIMCGHAMAPPQSPFPLSNRSSDTTPGSNTQRIAPTPPLEKVVADLACFPPKKLRRFQICWQH